MFNIKITSATSLSDLLDYVKNELSNVYTGEEVTVSSLFHGYEWERLPKGKRIKLGSMVLVYAESDEGKKVIEPVEKTPQNQQVYRKL